MRNRKSLNPESTMNLSRIFVFAALLLLGLMAALRAQEPARTQPDWWFGVAAGENLNFYGGTTQMLNPSLTAPAPFHKGFGTGLYLAPLIEYRPNPVWGGMLQVGYDARHGTFNDVTCPCGEIETLSAKLSYITVEPSLRVAPFSNALYAYVGPRLGFNWAPNLNRDGRSFHYTREGQPSTDGAFSNVRSTVFGAQIGLGYDFPFTSPDQRTQVEFSPFISYQPYLGSGPRTVENWAVSTLRIGVALKFGRGKTVSGSERAAVAASQEVVFKAVAPKAVPVKRTVHETFPLRNYVFFENGSATVPDRYVTLTKEQASDFKEEQLQATQPADTAGRSLRQMTVYYNILNILGDRLKRNPSTTVSLIGASSNGPEEGKARAEAIKRYWVEVFGIDGSRIATEGRDKPKIASEQPGGTKELELLRAGDQRVDIESGSSEMLMQVGGGSNFMLKPVAIVANVEDPLYSRVVFELTPKEAFTSWSIEATDDQGVTEQYGPYQGSRATISGNTILGSRSEGDYKIVMFGKKNDGSVVRKKTSIHLVRPIKPVQDALRFSILFDFDQSKTIASYEKFLTEVVTPLISDSSTVVIHGYSDIVGDEAYNERLSNDRVQETRDILERAISSNGKQGIEFETFGFGEDLQYAPFDSKYPEERFYNRTVIIDIVPN